MSRNLKEILEKTRFSSDSCSKFINRLKPEQIDKAIYFLDQGEKVSYKSLGELYNIICLECPGKTTGFLGKGVSGKVFSVYNQAMGLERALKVISADRVNEKEAQILTSFRKESPVNFPRIDDAGFRDDIRYDEKRAYFILMEKVDGETLDRKFEEEEALDYTCQIFDAIRYLRSKGVTHRDLHPRNIIITLEEIIKILDFGIVSEEETPEPKDNRRYGGPTDLFSLGLIAYKMFTGNHLILSKSEEMTTNSYANIIAKLKKNILENGRLKNSFREKIEENISDDDLKNVVFYCLESNKENESETIDDIFGNVKKIKKKIKKFKDNQLIEDHTRGIEGFDIVLLYKKADLHEKARELFGEFDRKGKALDLACGLGDSATCFKKFEVVNDMAVPYSRGLFKGSYFKAIENFLVSIVWFFLRQDPKYQFVKSIDYFDINEDMVKKGTMLGQIEKEFVKYGDIRDGLDYQNNYFDYIINRFFLHYLNDRQKKKFIYDVKRILKPEGKFLLADIVADTSEIQRFLNMQYARKTQTRRDCWTLTEPEYRILFESEGLEDIKQERYEYSVDTKDLLDKKQITQERFDEFNELLIRIINGKNTGYKNEEINEHLKLRKTDSGSVIIEYPLLLICGTKPA